MIQMQGFTVEHIEADNHLATTAGQPVRFELATQYEIKVDYAQSEQICIGHYQVAVNEKTEHPRLTVMLKLAARFSYTDGMEKTEIHRAVCEAMFPYVRALMTTVTANMNIPPVSINPPKIDEIYRFEKPNP